MLAPRGFIENEAEYGAAFERLSLLLATYPGDTPLPPEVDHELSYLAAEMDYFLLRTRSDIIKLH